MLNSPIENQQMKPKAIKDRLHKGKGSQNYAQESRNIFNEFRTQISSLAHKIPLLDHRKGRLVY